MQPDLDDLDQEIAQVRREKEAAIDRQDFQAAAALRDKEKQLLAARADREKEWAGVRCWPQDGGPGTGPAEYRSWKGCGPPCASTASSRATTLHSRRPW